MKITIFDVEHGACALIESETGARALIDCGHNSTTGWRPSKALPLMGIHYLDQLFVTNYDEDHVSDLHNLRQTVGINVLARNPTVTGYQLLALKTADATPGRGISELIAMTEAYTTPVTTWPDWGGIVFKQYWNQYPNDFEDENNLSTAVFVHHPQLSLLFPGDLEKAGWRKLLENPAFRADLARVHVLVASHHGREDGCCDELFASNCWRPQIVVISDDYKQYDTQETAAWYHARTLGIHFYGGRRHVFTTRRDGTIFIEATSYCASIDTNGRQLSALMSALAG